MTAGDQAYAILLIPHDSLSQGPVPKQAVKLFPVKKDLKRQQLQALDPSFFPILPYVGTLGYSILQKRKSRSERGS